jgi:hypothetical protein
MCAGTAPKAADGEHAKRAPGQSRITPADLLGTTSLPRCVLARLSVLTGIHARLLYDLKASAVPCRHRVDATHHQALPARPALSTAVRSALAPCCLSAPKAPSQSSTPHADSKLTLSFGLLLQPNQSVHGTGATPERQRRKAGALPFQEQQQPLQSRGHGPPPAVAAAAAAARATSPGRAAAAAVPAGRPHATVCKASMQQAASSSAWKGPDVPAVGSVAMTTLPNAAAW